MNNVYTFPALDTNQPTESKTEKRRNRLNRADDNRRKSALTLLMDEKEEKKEEQEEKEAMKKEDKKKGGKRRKTRKSTNKKKNKKTRSKKQKGGISSDEKQLIKAAKEGNTYLVGILLEKGVNMNVYDTDDKYGWGETALINAIDYGHIEIAKMLLEKGAYVDASNWNRSTALHAACIIGNTEMVKLLLEKEANVNAKNREGVTPIMNASENGNTEIVRILLENGADVNLHEKFSGQSALSKAVVENQIETISFLLENGADAHTQDERGRTPLSLAKYYKHPESSKIIQEHIDKQKLEQEQEASRQIQGIAKQIQKAAKYIEKAAEQIGPQHKVPEGLKENLGGKRKTRKSTKPKKNKKTISKKPQFLYNPNDPKKSFDVYIDKNPDDTITIKYTTVDDVKNTIQKLEKLYKNNKYSHKRIWQVGMIMKVRLEAMLKNKHLYPNAKNVKSRYDLSNKYFKFLGKRSQEKDDNKRKKMIFKS